MELFSFGKKGLSNSELIEQVKHAQSGPWNQYDIILKINPLGWNKVLEYSDSLIKKDIINLSSISVTDIVGGQAKELIELYDSNSKSIKNIAELQSENGILSFAGESILLKAPIKIVLFNQTNMIRIFTLVTDEKLINNYVVANF